MFCQANLKTHLFLAALLWFLVGILLLVKAFLFSLPNNYWLSLLAGLLFSVMAFSKIFISLVRKNISRLKKHNYKCIFAFQSFKSYLIVILMITIGLIINHFGLKNKYIVFIYSAVGTSLIIGSFTYIQEIRKLLCG